MNKTKLAFFGLIFTSLFLISTESFWVDEGISASWLIKDSLSNLFSDLLSNTESESQMPLYIICIWFWGLIVPHTEWFLRSLNLIFLIGTGLFIYNYSKRYDNSFILLTFFVQPFLWKYVGEFRPYLLQIFLHTIQIIMLLDLYNNKNIKYRTFLLITSSFLSCFVHMLSVIPFIIISLIILFCVLRKKIIFFKQEIKVILISIPLFFFLGLYYLQTLLRDAGGAKLWDPSIKNYLFSIYEMIGLSGIGPSYLMIRDIASNEILGIIRLFIDYIPIVSIFLVVFVLLILNLRFINDKNNKLLIIFLTSVFLILITLSSLANWPFWGRHLAPIFPAYTIILSTLISFYWKKNNFAKIISLTLLLLLIFSSFNNRFNDKYAKEDYRGVMNYVGTHSDDTLILMGINKPTFLFYEKYFQDEYKFDNAIFVKDLKKNPLNVPDKIILTRPNAIDSDFYIRKYITDNNFEEDISKFVGFKIYRRL